MRTLFLATLLAAGAQSTCLADTLIVGNKNDNTVSFIDLDTGQEVRRLPTGVGPHEVAVSPDGSAAVVTAYGTSGADGNELHVYDVVQGKQTGVIDLGRYTRPHGIRFVDNDRLIVTSETTQSIVQVSVEKAAIEKTYPTDGGLSHMVAVTPDGAWAFTSNMSSDDVSMVSLTDTTETRLLASGDDTEGIAITPDGALVWAANRREDTVSVFSIATGERVAKLKTGQFPYRVAVTADGQYAVTSNGVSSSLSVFDANEITHVKDVDIGIDDAPVQPATVGAHPHKPLLYLTLATSAQVAEISTDTWTITRTFEVGKNPDGLDVSILSVQGD